MSDSKGVLFCSKIPWQALVAVAILNCEHSSCSLVGTSSKALCHELFTSCVPQQWNASQQRSQHAGHGGDMARRQRE
jgi:hypothetical protein